MKRLLPVILCLIFIIQCVPAVSATFEGDDKIVIVIDPGHGGANVGTARNGTGEKVMTFKLGMLLKEKLEANGNFIVHMTRTGDYDLPLAARGIYANTVNADLLVSLHFDGSTSGYDRGVSVITSVLPEYEMTALAKAVCNSLNAKTGLPIKGVIQRKDNEGYYWNAAKQWDCKDPSLGILSDYYGIPTWCSKFGIGSILIEHGFFTNSGDAAIIFADGMLDKMAEADAEAIINYYTNHTHTYEASPTQDFPSNCMFTGKQSVRCSICDHRKNVTELAPAPDNHYWINEKSQNASCGVDGYVSRQCRITLNLNEKDVPCENHEEIKYIKAQPHSYYISDSKEVTHTVDGFYQYTCSNCGHTYRETIASEGHSWQLTDHIEPKCTQVGKMSYQCSDCKETKEETLPALGHSLTVTEYKQNSCTEDGYSKAYCTACKEEVNEIFKATGHDMTVNTPIAATCTSDGENFSYCNTCGYEEKSVIPKTGHTMEEKEKVNASCEKKGYIIRKCSSCEYEEKEELDAIGHSFTTEVTAEASLFVRGVKLTTCGNCGDNYNEVIPSTWDNPATKIIIIGGASLIAAVIFTIILFYLRKKNAEPEGKEDKEEIADKEDKDELLTGIMTPSLAEEKEAESEEEASDEAEKSKESESDEGHRDSSDYMTDEAEKIVEEVETAKAE